MARPAVPFTTETAKAAKAKAGPKRSRDQIIADTLNAYLEKSISAGDQRTRQEIMVEAAFKEFLKGNSRPMQYLMDRGFSKPRQPIEHSGTLGGVVEELSPEDRALIVSGLTTKKKTKKKK